jgi:MFS family permease
MENLARRFDRASPNSIFAATSFTLICAFIPFIHSYSLLITALVLAGLASGTFYPLTLTFALRNIPLRFLPFTIALYATFVDGAVNIAPSLYGWCRDHLSWHWMFWNSAVITPVMMLCIYYGIPAAPAKKKSPRRQVSQVFYMPVQGSQCFMLPSIKAKGSTGGAP